eukprot:254923_1
MTEEVNEDVTMSESTDISNQTPKAVQNEDKPKKEKKKKKKKKKKKAKKPKRNLPPGYKRVQKELQMLLLHPPIGVSACPMNRDDILEWIATIDGPKDTPYEGGKFYLRIVFGEDYPFNPPEIKFKTKIYHCNIKSSNGEICLDVLKDNYSPALTVEKILLSLCVLLENPNPDDPLVADIAQILLIDREEHDKTAKEWTRRYAMTAEQ